MLWKWPPPEQRANWAIIVSKKAEGAGSGQVRNHSKRTADLRETYAVRSLVPLVVRFQQKSSQEKDKQGSR